jgi:lysophospholipase L1-like esterase
MAVNDIRICFVGDSFVNGTGDETYLGWVGRVCAASKSPDISLTCYNLGIRRNTSKDILQRWKLECALRLPDFCEGRVVLSCGVNDMLSEHDQLRVSPEDSRNNVRHILQQSSAKYKTIMVGPPPVGDAELNSRIKTISAAYAQEASALGIPFIDVFSPLVTDRQYLQESRNNDGLHPRSYGYSAIARIIGAANDWWFKQTADN